MKKIIVCMLFMCALFVGAASNEANFKEVQQVNSTVSMKQQASQQAKTIGTVARGEFVTVEETFSGWAKISYKGKGAYVQASALKTPTSTIKVAGSKGGLVVKTSNSKSSKTVAVLKHNMVLEDFGAVGAGWSFVQYGNVTGYVATNFMSVPKSTKMHVIQDGQLRNIASRSGTVLHHVEQGTAVTAYSTIAGWTYVATKTGRGYIEAAKLSARATITRVTTGLTPNCSKFTSMRYLYIDSFESMQVDEFCVIEDGVPAIGTEEVTEGYYREGNSLWINNGISPPLLIEFPLYVGKTWSSYGGGFSTYQYRVVSLNEVFELEDKTIHNVVKIDIGGSFIYLAHEYGIVSRTINGMNGVPATIQLYSAE